MVDINKLKGKIVEKGYSISSLANATGIKKGALYRKLSNGSKFLIKDADTIAHVLCLNAEEVNAIFFSQYVA